MMKRCLWRVIFALVFSPAAFAVTVDATNAQAVAEQCDRMWQAFAASGDEHGMQSVGENPDCLTANKLLAERKRAQDKKQAGDRDTAHDTTHK